MKFLKGWAFAIAFISIVGLMQGCMETASPGPDKSEPEERNDRFRTGYYFFNGEYHKLDYEMVDGVAMYGGDMRLIPELLYETPPPSALAKSTGAQSYSKWPSRKIPYVIQSNWPTASNARIQSPAAVQRALDQLMGSTNLIFYPRTTEADYMSFVRVSGGLASAPLGYGVGGVATISISDAASDDASSQVHVGRIMHEIMHSLGFGHEQQRQDRDNTLDVYGPGYESTGRKNYHCSNGYKDINGVVINPNSPDKNSVYNSTTCPGWQNNWNKSSIVTYGTLDLNSIMMYASVNGGLQGADGKLLINPLSPGYGYCVMLPKGSAISPIPNYFETKATLSSGDVGAINALYPTSPTSIGWIDRGGTCNGTRGFFGMDDEDNGNNTQAFVKTGHVGGFSVAYTAQTGLFKNVAETRLNFCKESKTVLPRIKHDYAVLRMGPSCPRNGYGFSRWSHNEQTGNGNSNSGNISPSIQSTGAGKDTYLTIIQYCFFPGDGVSTMDPPWAANRQGVLAMWNADFGPRCREYHHHMSDDEDTNNAFSNSDPYSFSTEAVQFSSRIRGLFNNSTTETHYFWNACP